MGTNSVHLETITDLNFTYINENYHLRGRVVFYNARGV